MDFFGIGPLEIVLILVLAFLFFGPEKLPEIAAKIGNIYRNLTKSTSDFTKAINDEIALEKEQKNTQSAPEKVESQPKTAEILAEPVNDNHHESTAVLTKSDERTND
jgi:sec-independent protein translocase protein TatA